MNAGIADPEVRKKKLNAELANGRLAMFAIIGMFFQDGLTGSAWGDWANYTDSPLRAFEGELGVQPPVGFWDPLGLSADGDVAVFKRRREVELKHGRISMFAAIGYIVPEYFKWPGDLSPKLGLKFADIPNGLAAISKVPGQGWAQIVAFLGTYELFINKPVGAEPGNYGKGNLGLGFLGPVADPEARKKKLSAELANGRWLDWIRLGRRETEIKHGRVAMFATIGYIVPEYYKFDGFLSPSMNLKFTDALSVVPKEGWAQIVAFAGFLELVVNKKTTKKLSAEVANGRLAMMAIIGMFFQDGLTGSAWGDWANYTDSPLRSGVKSPGYNTLPERRETEIKHGRVAMFATIGYIVPEYYKFDGFLSPSMNLKFTDALSVVPKEGWAQIVAFAGFLELVVNKKTFFQDGLTGSAWGDWANYTDSPLRAFEGELGVQPPAGFWDPLGFTKGGDAASFRRRRYVELKHGRVAMFACLGYIVPEYYRWPGDLSPSLGLKFSDVPTGFAAFSKVPLSGWAQIVAFAGTVELFQYVDDPKRAPGDFENAGFLGVPNSFVKINDPEVKKKKLASELANGRLAMMAIIGMFFQNGLTGDSKAIHNFQSREAWGNWSLYTDSPLRAFEGELGVQAPVGFWDPLGLSADGDVDTFKRRRAVELKHGRICMLACVGYIVPEYFRWPGYLSPEKGIKFADMPHGIAAISKVPLEGWVQIALFLGHYEGYFWRQDPKRAPGDYEGYGFLGVGKNFIFNFDPIEFKDPEVRKTKLAAEIANGRLAMVALMAMLFQNGTVGTTGPAMWLPAA
eukprot:symbB.v1.2.006212.t1/scaffold355.1/size243294/22